jgi:hypothetical protein
MDDGGPHDVDMELEGNGPLDIYDHVVHRAKKFKWEGNSFLRMWANGQVKVVPCP